MVATVSTTVLESYRFIQAPGTQSIIVTQTEVNGQFQAVYYSGQPITIPPDHLILGATTLKDIAAEPSKVNTTPAAPASNSISTPITSTTSSSSSPPPPTPPSSSTSSPSPSSSPSIPSPAPSASGDNTPSTSNTPSNSTNGTHTKHISSGGAAGIGIGSAIGGALIAAFIVWFLMRKPHGRGNRSRGGMAANGFTGRGRNSQGLNDSESGTIEFEDRSASAIIERTLPQPEDDHTIGGEVSKLCTLIKNHVQSYYHNGPLKPNSGGIDQAEMERAAGNMPISSSTLTSLLANPKTRIDALRFYVSWIIIQRLEPTCDPDRTLLPPEVAGCFASMKAGEDFTSTRMAFLSKWRSISTFLLKRRYGQTDFSRDDARIENIRRGLATLDSVLSTYADGSRDNQKRLLNLEEIIKRAARFGFLLFSQPSLWKFGWDRPAGGGFVVFPGFQQIGDENGQTMRQPRVVEEPEISRGTAGI